MFPQATFALISALLLFLYEALVCRVARFLTRIKRQISVEKKVFDHNHTQAFSGTFRFLRITRS